MAFTKSLTIPGFNVPVSYIRIDRINTLDETTREAKFTFGFYVDQNTSQTAGSRGFYHAGRMDVRNNTFTAYFSRTALAASNNSVHAQAYQLIKDYIAAKAATSPTPEQTALLKVGEVVLANDFGGPALFVGATDA